MALRAKRAFWGFTTIEGILNDQRIGLYLAISPWLQAGRFRISKRVSVGEHCWCLFHLVTRNGCVQDHQDIGTRSCNLSLN